MKIFPNEAFGYMRITVERPLRLRWEVTAETIALVEQAKQWAKLTSDEQADLTEQLHGLEGTSTTDRTVLAKKLGSVPKGVEKTLWDALAVRDEDAPVITNRKGIPDPDPELRDNENVSLPAMPTTWQADPEPRLASPEYRSAVEGHMAAEVLPYLSNAKLGYEIPITRHFYKYAPPRPLVEIDSEIKALEAEIQDLLREVAK